MTTHSMLSTIDNPYNPFDEYRRWYEFDTRLGYNTAAFLARLTFTSYELSEVDQALAVENAVDEAVEENVLGLYIKVTKEIEDKVVKGE